MKKLLLLLLLCPFFSKAQINQKVKKVDSLLTYLQERDLFNGTVLIGNKGKIVFKKAYGITNTPDNKKLTTASAFNLASVSKQFYTMMAMILKEQGKLKFDDKVNRYLPEFPYDQITVRQLMNHTSGLPEYFDFAQNNMGLLDTLTNESLLELIAIKKPDLVFQPGEKFKYCNTNYTTLASIIEELSGIPADQFFKKYIADPLNMTNSYVYTLKMKTYPESRVFGFKIEGGKKVLNDLVRFDGVVGDGNIYSTVEDLYKWDQALYTEKLVKQSTFQEAITSGKLNNGKETGYGFGWFIPKPGEIVQHSGGWVGFNTMIVRHIKTNETLIILDNSGNYRAAGLATNLFEGRPIKVPVTSLISNVNLIDGTGTAGRKVSVRIIDAKIRDIGELTAFKNEEIIDGKGKVLAPGFIDSHSHHDRGLEDHPESLSTISQGITTIVVGQDGGGIPIDSIQNRMKNKPVSTNVATYTGHGMMRSMAMGTKLFRTSKPSELDTMKAILARELEKGSLGLATGLEYEDAFYSNRDEVVDLAKVAASKGGRYTSHIRSEDMNLEESLDEIIQIGKRAKIPVQISHLKIAMVSKWGKSHDILAQLAEARAKGVNITADVYPYQMWMSTPRVLFPKKDFNNEESAIFATKQLFDPAQSYITNFSANKSFEGKTITEIGQMNQESPAKTLMRIVREAEEKDGTSVIAATSMSEEDVINFLAWPNSSICSDGSVGGHPRGHGSFPRVLGKYVREQKIMSLETAIYKMTGLAAENTGIKNRGIVTSNYYADLVLFDHETVKDNATIANPTALSDGILMVWVNGKVVFKDGKATNVFSGKFVKRGE